MQPVEIDRSDGVDGLFVVGVVNFREDIRPRMRWKGFENPPDRRQRGLVAEQQIAFRRALDGKAAARMRGADFERITGSDTRCPG